MVFKMNTFKSKMTDSNEAKSGAHLIRYYCTAGNGMELFLMEEVKKKLAAEDIDQIPGKVIFSSSADIHTVCQLKTAERLFLLVKQDHPVLLSAKMNSAKAASILQSRLLGDIDQWTSAVLTWSRLQGALEHRLCSVNRLNGSTGEKTVPCRNVVQLSDEPSGGNTTETKRKRDDDSDDAEENANKVDTSGEENQMPMRLNVTQRPSASISFRINCKCTGSLSRYFGPQDVSRVIGAGLSRPLGWKVDLKNPQVEVSIHLSDDYCLMGIPLTRLPLANRCYIKTTGLRSTIAWAIASLAQIQPGFCVLDPMCGVGTILIEAAQEHSGALFIGMDIDDGQIQKANENINFAEVGDRIHVMKASSMMIPLPDAKVDAVVCDLPFGRKFGTRVDMAAKLPLILSEMERVLCVGGTLVLLLSPQLSCLLKKLLEENHTELSPKHESKPQAGAHGRPHPPSFSARRDTLQIIEEDHSSPTKKTDRHTALCTFQSSLKLQETFRVSLGLIDGIIHKYVKINT